MGDVALYLGVDVGTQGVRAVVRAGESEVINEASVLFPPEPAPRLPEGWHEQSPHQWWLTTAAALSQTVGSLRDKGSAADQIAAAAVTSTSGTVVLLDQDARPLRGALMYNDGRATAQAEAVRPRAADLATKLGYSFQSSFALPKLLWLKDNEPDVFRQARFIAHAADFVVGRLTGRWGVSDRSNVLKTGYDLVDSEWPASLLEQLGLPLGLFPAVQQPGTRIDRVCASAAEETGLSTGTMVAAGATDGTAAFIASGAVAPGEWNSTLGTTLVLRGVSEELIRDPKGRIYCHAHPEGYWLPGGASNVGGECLEKEFPDEDYAVLDERVRGNLPNSLVVYPLVRKGERFPFVSAAAEGFLIGDAADREVRYAAYLEGVALVERWCFDLLAELGAPCTGAVYASGGGARSRPWLQLRADVLRRELLVSSAATSAAGAAILAACAAQERPLTDVVRDMVRIAVTVEPESGGLVPYFDEKYERLRTECRNRGYC